MPFFSAAEPFACGRASRTHARRRPNGETADAEGRRPPAITATPEILPLRPTMTQQKACSASAAGASSGSDRNAGEVYGRAGRGLSGAAVHGTPGKISRSVFCGAWDSDKVSMPRHVTPSESFWRASRRALQKNPC